MIRRRLGKADAYKQEKIREGRAIGEGKGFQRDNSQVLWDCLSYWSAMKGASKRINAGRRVFSKAAFDLEEAGGRGSRRAVGGKETPNSGTASGLHPHARVRS